jgi:phosphohistidine phosphatase
MLLYIIRHAWAYEHGDPRWPDDSKRPLEDEGAERFTKVVKALAKRGFAPELIATSPYLRCRQTADIAAEALQHRPTVVERDALAPGGDTEELIAWSQEQAVEQLAWVGHSPFVESLVAEMISDSIDASVRMAKGAVAAVKFNGDLEPGAGELQWLATAKLLGV